MAWRNPWAKWLEKSDWSESDLEYERNERDRLRKSRAARRAAAYAAAWAWIVAHVPEHEPVDCARTWSDLEAAGIRLAGPASVRWLCRQNGRAHVLSRHDTYPSRVASSVLPWLRARLRRSIGASVLVQDLADDCIEQNRLAVSCRALRLILEGEGFRVVRRAAGLTVIDVSVHSHNSA